MKNKTRSSVLPIMAATLVSCAIEMHTNIQAQAPPHAQTGKIIGGGFIAPPHTAWPQQDTLRVLGQHSLIGMVSVDTKGRSIDVNWSYDDPATGTRSFFPESFNLSYWPTAVASIGTSTLVVGGKRPADGDTIIERWDLSWNSAIPSEADPTIVATTVLYQDKQPRMRDPKSMTAFVGTNDYVLVQYASGDLYKLSVVDGSQNLIYSSIQVPKLALESVTHAGSARVPGSSQHVYVISSDRIHQQDGGILFFDDDGDGNIDRFLTVENDQWGTVVIPLQLDYL